MFEIVLCRECLQVLTDEEVYYYESRCEECEREWAIAIDEWRHGGENPKFDALYGGPEPTKH